MFHFSQVTIESARLAFGKTVKRYQMRIYAEAIVSAAYFVRGGGFRKLRSENRVSTAQVALEHSKFFDTSTAKATALRV